MSEGLDRLPQFKLPEEAASYSHQDVSNYLTGWLMLAGIASVLYLIFGSPLGVGGVSVLLSYSDLILPTLLMTSLSALVLAGLPLLFLRKSPFTLPILQTWGKSFWFFALATGLASAITLDMLVPEQQVTVRYAGELHSTSRKQGAHYYLQAVEAGAPVAFGESVRYIPLTRQQYETLSGLQDNERGVFDATFDQGVLFAPYVVKVKRVRTDNFTQ